jgi:hypothetical protein
MDQGNYRVEKMPERDCSRIPQHDLRQSALRFKKLDEQAEDESWDAGEKFSQKMALAIRIYREEIGELPAPEPISTLEEEQAAMRQRWATAKWKRKRGCREMKTPASERR